MGHGPSGVPGKFREGVRQRQAYERDDGMHGVVRLHRNPERRRGTGDSGNVFGGGEVIPTPQWTRSKTRSINLVVSSDGFEKNRVVAFVLHKLKHHPEIVTGALSLRAGEFSFELVRLELRMKGVLRQQFKRELKFDGQLGMLAGEAAGGTNEDVGRQEQPFQAS